METIKKENSPNSCLVYETLKGKDYIAHECIEFKSYFDREFERDPTGIEFRDWYDEISVSVWKIIKLRLKKQSFSIRKQDIPYLIEYLQEQYNNFQKTKEL